MYIESGLSDEKIEFLRKLFDGAAALYGLVTLNNLWKVYNELSKKTAVIKIHRKDIFAFSSIARREVHDYCIYEIDELYAAEERSDNQRYIILSEIIDRPRHITFYPLEQMQEDYDFYVPEDLLTFKGHIVTEAERRLVDYIENLKATSPVIYRNKFNRDLTEPSPHQGKRLKEFSYLSKSEQFEIDWMSGKIEDGPKTCQKNKLSKYMSTVEGTVAEKLFRNLRFLLFTSGHLTFADIIRYFMDDLLEVGVELSFNETKKLLTLIQEFNNNSHLYKNRGWTPFELAQIERTYQKGPMTLTFGPGIMKAAKEGSISLEELKEQARKMGFNVE